MKTTERRNGATISFVYTDRSSGPPHTAPWHAHANMGMRVAMQYKHLEHTFYSSPSHFSRSSYTTSCVSAMENSKIDLKYSRPQRAWGAWTVKSIRWCGPTEETCSLKTQKREGLLEFGLRVGGRRLRISREKGLPSRQRDSRGRGGVESGDSGSTDLTFAKHLKQREST